MTGVILGNINVCSTRVGLREQENRIPSSKYNSNKRSVNKVRESKFYRNLKFLDSELEPNIIKNFVIPDTIVKIKSTNK